MSKFTPGPWEIDAHGQPSSANDPYYYVIEATYFEKQFVIADTMNCGCIFTPEDQRANAVLIAAAPDMRAFIDYQANLIDSLIERLGDADLVDSMDRVEFNKWSQAYQQIVAKIEGEHA